MTVKKGLQQIGVGILLALVASGEVVRARAEDETKDDPKRSRYQQSRLTNDESESVADRRSLTLSTGEDKAVDLDFEANGGANGIAIGNPLLVTTTLVKIGEKRQIVFKPLKAGETTVTVRDADGTIRLIFNVRITGSNLLRVASEIRNLLRDVEGIEIRIVGPKVVIEGELLVPADYGRLSMVISEGAYKDYILNLASLSPLALQFLAKKIQSDVSAFAANVHTRVVNGVIFLEGQVDSQDVAKRVVDIAEIYLPEVRLAHPLEGKDGAKVLTHKPIQSFLMVNPPPPKKNEKLVRVTVHFVELAKDYSKVFGFKWQPGFTSDPQISVGSSAAGGAGAAGASFTATISSLVPRLFAAQQAGYARVLKTGTVIVRSGQPAVLKEETQVPYAVTGANGQVTSASTTVGLAVAVTPLILGQTEDIQLELKLDQTDAVGKLEAGKAPITAAHKVETRLYVKSNESAAVAGINSSDVGTDFNKDDPSPGSFSDAKTAPLFNLMRTKAYRKKKSQFVIFVTPQIVENASEGTEDLKKNFRVKVK